MYLAPLQCPFCESRFRKNMMGLPTFIMMLYVRRPQENLKATSIYKYKYNFSTFKCNNNSYDYFGHKAQCT